MSPTVVGVNVPPPPLSLGVIVTVPVTVPPTGNATVNGAEATPTVPDEGPVKVYVVAVDSATEVYLKLIGLKRVLLLVVATVLMPGVAGV
jgi:hypothetical protein